MNTGFLGPAVATVLTVYGIETYLPSVISPYNTSLVATVLTVYGIETEDIEASVNNLVVATVLTVYGIETI